MIVADSVDQWFESEAAAELFEFQVKDNMLLSSFLNLKCPPNRTQRAKYPRPTSTHFVTFSIMV